MQQRLAVLDAREDGEAAVLALDDAWERHLAVGADGAEAGLELEPPGRAQQILRARRCIET